MSHTIKAARMPGTRGAPVMGGSRLLEIILVVVKKAVVHCAAARHEPRAASREPRAASREPRAGIEPGYLLLRSRGR